jgi:PhzF family phenazine biosynthesis protein
MGQKIVQVDAFTNRAFAGNPAAVCILEKPASVEWMKNVAREMNLAETAFLVPRGEQFDLRWFTPMVEVKLCGHATLASAHVLWEDGHLPVYAQARFDTLSGILTAYLEDGWIRLDFPAKLSEEVAPPSGLLEALGVSNRVFVGKNVFDYLVEIDSEDELRKLDPDLTQLAKVEARGVIVTARSKEYDFVSRFFAPAVGVPEDPVTGSAHCALTPYWSAKLSKKDMIAFQASARGGMMKVSMRDDRVWMSGQAVTVLRGELVNTPAVP